MVEPKTVPNKVKANNQKPKLERELKNNGKLRKLDFIFLTIGQLLDVIANARAFKVDG
jgi:hypothetical protein